MQDAEQRTVCSVCGPDQSVWHSEQKWTVNDQGAPSSTDSVQYFFSMMLKQDIQDLDEDGTVYIRYRFDCSLFNLRRLHAHTKTHEQLFSDFLFVDDTALVAHTERALQYLTGLRSVWRRLMFFTSLHPNKITSLPTPITNGRTKLKAVHQFTYLGCMYHHIRRQNRQGSRQQIGQGKQRFR